MYLSTTVTRQGVIPQRFVGSFDGCLVFMVTVSCHKGRQGQQRDVLANHLGDVFSTNLTRKKQSEAKTRCQNFCVLLEATRHNRIRVPRGELELLHSSELAKLSVYLTIKQASCMQLGRAVTSSLSIAVTVDQDMPQETCILAYLAPPS